MHPPSPGLSDAYDDMDEDFLIFEEEELTYLTDEGGVNLFNYLIANVNEPVADNVCEWQYCDIQHLPEEELVKWQQACQYELDMLKQCGVFEVTNLPPGRKAVKCRWVFNVKSDGHYRARLVAEGFSQVEGVDYKELFSLVVRYKTVRLLLALAALEDWHLQALDVKSAYLYGNLDKEIYMEQPEGFKMEKGKVWRLRKALYSLKQGAVAWWKECDKSMHDFHFKHSLSDAGVFIYIEGNCHKLY